MTSNMTSSTFVWIRILYLFILTVSVSIHHVESLPSGTPDKNDSNVERLSLTKTPQNVAAMVGSTVVLECEVDQAPPITRVMWGEFITHTGGTIISDNDNIVTHPNAARYKIIHTTPTEFNLEIRDLQLSDGGRYVCQDTLSSSPNVYRGEAELIVLESVPVCAGPIFSNGVLIEGETYTAECAWTFQGKYPPTMTWSGPPPFNLIQSTSNSTSVSSRIEFTAERSENGVAYKLVTDFKDIGSGTLPPDTSPHIPTWQSIYSFPLAAVNWEPRNVYIEPLKTRYYVGEILTCHAYANPSPFYQWLNTRTLESVSGQTFTITESMVGYNQTLLCQAQNFIIDKLYSAQVTIEVLGAKET